MSASFQPSLLARERAARLEHAIDEWLAFEDPDAAEDIAEALWCEHRCPPSLALREDRLSQW